jgi:hypothetical protein
MSDKIKYTDIADKGLFDPLIKGAEDTAKALEALAVAQRAVLKESKQIAKLTPLETFEDVEKVERAILEAAEAVEKLNKAEKERNKLQKEIKKVNDQLAKEKAKQVKQLSEEEKLQQKINKAKSEEGKRIAKLRAELQAVNKANREANKEKKEEVKQLTEVEKLQQKLARAKSEEGKQIAKLKKELREVNKEKKEEVKQLTEVEKAEAKLAKARSAEGKRLAELRLQIQETNREQKESIKLAKENSPYAILSNTLNKLTKEYQDLAAAEKGNTKEAKALNKEITKLDKKLKKIDTAVGRNQRRVGSYIQAIEKLNTRFRTFQGLAVIGILTSIAGAFRQNEEGGKAFDKTINILIGSISLLVGGFVNAITKSEDFFDFFGKLKGEFEDFDKKLLEVVDSQTKLVDDTINTTKATADLTEQIAAQVEQLKALDVAANDNTLSLQKQLKAEKDAFKARKEIARLEAEIANENLELAKEKADANRDARGDDKLDAAVALDLAEARKASAEAQNNLLTVRAESAKRLREIERDQTELELDALLDGFDRRKTVNEAIIADETLSLKRRREALAENVKELENSLDKELELLQANAKERIDIEDLLEEKDIKAFNDKIKRLELDEVLTKRLLEVINETRQAREDNRQSERDLKAAEQNTNQLEEEIKLLKELSKELEENAGNLKKQAKVRQENAIKTLEKEIELLNLRLETVDKTSNEGLAIQKEILEKEGELFDQRAAKQLEANKKVIDGVKQSAEVVAGLLSNINKKALSDIDRLIEGSETRLEQLREAASEQAQSATENLALEEKRQAELQAKREKILKRQQREALILSTIQAYTARLSAGDNPAQALGATVRDTTFLRSFIESLPAFWEGAERVGDVLEPAMAGRDGHIVRVDGARGVYFLKQYHSLGHVECRAGYAGPYSKSKT